MPFAREELLQSFFHCGPVRVPGRVQAKGPCPRNLSDGDGFPPRLRNNALSSRASLDSSVDDSWSLSGT
ncbi:hypothetical protein CLOM_g21749 [Closterium sp. NIES-68]|nr:hypothetical protein CLOM_g21749 [Closterium sp. NIES-68]